MNPTRVGVREFFVLLAFLVAFSGCSQEPVKFEQFTDEQLDQISVSTEGDMKYFSIPGRNLEIGMYLPSYTIKKQDFAVFQATRHYDGEQLITVVTTIISSKTGVRDLDSCVAYRKKYVGDFTTEKDKDKIILSKVYQKLNSKSTIILQFHDGLCIETFIVTSQLSNASLKETERIVESVQIRTAEESSALNAGEQKPAKTEVREVNKEIPLPEDFSSLHIEGMDWIMGINISGFKETDDGFKERFQSRFLVASRGLVHLSIFAEKINNVDDIDSCRMWVIKTIPAEIKSDYKEESRSGKALSIYQREFPEGSGLISRHFHAFVYHQGYCYDFHFSKYPFNDENEMNELYDIIDSIKIVEMPEKTDSVYTIKSIEIG